MIQLRKKERREEKRKEKETQSKSCFIWWYRISVCVCKVWSVSRHGAGCGGQRSLLGLRTGAQAPGCGEREQGWGRPASACIFPCSAALLCGAQGSPPTLNCWLVLIPGPSTVGPLLGFGDVQRPTVRGKLLPKEVTADAGREVGGGGFSRTE